MHFQILHRRFVEGKGNWGEGGGSGEEGDEVVVEASRKWIDEQTVSSVCFSHFQIPFFGIRIYEG